MLHIAEPNDWIVVNLSHNLPAAEVAHLVSMISSSTRKCYVTTPEIRAQLSAKMPASIGLNWTHPENTNYIDITIVDGEGKPVELPTIADLTMWGEIRSRFPHLRFEYEGDGLSTDAVRVSFETPWRRFMLDNGLGILTEVMGAALQPFYLNRIETIGIDRTN